MLLVLVRLQLVSQQLASALRLRKAAALRSPLLALALNLLLAPRVRVTQRPVMRRQVRAPQGRRLIRGALPTKEAALPMTHGRQQPAVPNLAPAREPLLGLSLRQPLRRRPLLAALRTVARQQSPPHPSCHSPQRFLILHFLLTDR